MFVARKAVFLKREFISKKNSGSKVQFEKIQNPQIPIEDSMEIERTHNELWRSNLLHKYLEDQVGLVTSVGFSLCLNTSNTFYFAHRNYTSTKKHA